MMLFHSGEDGTQRPAYPLPGDEIEFNRRNVFRPDQARDFAAGTCRSDDRRSAVVDPGLKRRRATAAVGSALRSFSLLSEKRRGSSRLFVWKEVNCGGSASLLKANSCSGERYITGASRNCRRPAKRGHGRPMMQHQ